MRTHRISDWKRKKGKLKREVGLCLKRVSTTNHWDRLLMSSISTMVFSERYTFRETRCRLSTGMDGGNGFTLKEGRFR